MDRPTTQFADAAGRQPRRQAALPPSSAPPSQRLVSVDALRGFTMFWIVGGSQLVLAVLACLATSLAETLKTQLEHPDWGGFVAWDLIMPLFLFVAGTSIPFAIGKRAEQGVPLRTAYGRIFRRVLVLWILGMVAHGNLLMFRLDSLQLYSDTLQAIAVGYLVSAVALLHLPLRGQVGLFAALTLAYWALLAFVPFGGHPAGTLEREVNLPRYVDEWVLGSFRRDHSFTWIVTSLGFAATVLLGTMAGHLLRGRLAVRRKLAWLTASGLACLAAGWIWSYWVPLNRYLWTSPTILWTGGWGFLLVALFYAVIDVAGVKRWSFFFVVLGANALLAYVFAVVVGRDLSNILVGGLAEQWPETYGELLRSIAEVGLLSSILWYLYRNRTFLRA